MSRNKRPRYVAPAGVSDRDRAVLEKAVNDSRTTTPPRRGSIAKRVDGLMAPKKPNLSAMPRVNYAPTTTLNQFLLDYRSGAEFVFDIHPHLLNPQVFEQIDRCIARRWPNLWRSDMRALMEGPLNFVKLIPLGSAARTDCMLKFMDALWTAHWAGWLDKLITKTDAEPTLGQQLEALLRGPGDVDSKLRGLTLGDDGYDITTPPAFATDAALPPRSFDVDVDPSPFAEDDDEDGESEVTDD